MSSPILLLGLLVLVGVSSGTPSASDQIRNTGGTESVQGKWPFFARIFYNGQFIPHCGGVIWDNETILTAAHCIITTNQTSFEPKSFEIYLGHNEFNFQKNQAYLFKAKEIIIHPDFKVAGSSNDIALIRLERSIDFDGLHIKVECVCDPEPWELLETTKCVTMGWGVEADNSQHASLYEVVLPLLNDRSCAWQSSHFDPKSHLCAGSLGAGTCAGDTGGPLVCPLRSDPSRYSLVGTTAFFVSPCGQHPSYFTRVEYYLKWIEQQNPFYYKVD